VRLLVGATSTNLAIYGVTRAHHFAACGNAGGSSAGVGKGAFSTWAASSTDPIPGAATHTRRVRSMCRSISDISASGSSLRVRQLASPVYRHHLISRTEGSRVAYDVFDTLLAQPCDSEAANRNQLTFTGCQNETPVDDASERLRQSGCRTSGPARTSRHRPLRMLKP
jgi:hypothetical protein